MSSLDEYAQQFWQREKQKGNRDGEHAISLIAEGRESPVSLLANLHPYKLPQPYNATIELVEFGEVDELDRLLIHDYMIRDDWMIDRCLVPCPKTRRLGDLARIALDRRYFETERDDTQLKRYKAWRAGEPLDGFIGDKEYPLLEQTWERELEIVDGWGRLHAMSALTRRGCQFKPFKAFVASRAGIETPAVADGGRESCS
jgi:hypothetical protein